MPPQATHASTGVDELGAEPRFAATLDARRSALDWHRAGETLAKRSPPYLRSAPGTGLARRRGHRTGATRIGRPGPFTEDDDDDTTPSARQSGVTCSSGCSIQVRATGLRARNEITASDGCVYGTNDHVDLALASASGGSWGSTLRTAGGTSHGF